MFELIRKDANIVLPYPNKLNVSVLHDEIFESKSSLSDDYKS